MDNMMHSTALFSEFPPIWSSGRRTGACIRRTPTTLELQFGKELRRHWPFPPCRSRMQSISPDIWWRSQWDSSNFSSGSNPRRSVERLRLQQLQSMRGFVGFSVSNFIQLALGHLEKLISVPIADVASVNAYESEREQSRIIRRQFCGARPVGAIFRGAH